MKTLIMLLAALVLAVLGATAAHASVTVPPAHHIARVSTESWTDAMGYKYKADIRSLGRQSVSFNILQDSGHQWMHAWTICDSGDHRTGPNTRHAGNVTTTAPLCPAGNLGLHKWGVQSYQYGRKPNHRYYRVWVTHIFGCNVGSC